MNFKLTNNGINLLLRGLAGETITFTKITIGNGDSQEAGSATALSNELLSLEIASTTRQDTNIKLHVLFNNSFISDGFRMTEVGIWAQDMDDSTEDVLYAYGTEDEDNADRIAATNEVILETQLDFFVFVGDTQNVAAIINDSLTYATKGQLDAHTGNNTNPHGVNKEQVGLCNVPNVTTDDQTPSFTIATANANLTSGERLSVAFGKIAKAIKSLIVHLADNRNPHTVTTTQIGAAKSNHKHSAVDITSGTLSTARGGTSRASWSAQQLIYAGSAAELSQVPRPTENGQTLLQDKSTGAPHWGFLSNVECGYYVGSGESGSLSNSTNLIFSRGLPKVIIIGKDSVVPLLIFPESEIGFKSNGDEITVYRTGGIVSFYSTSAAAQLNVSGTTYRYAALF